MGIAENHRVEEVSVDETWKRLAADPNAVLIDVRTQAEWAFVGVPDLSSIGKQPMLAEWQSFPESRVDPGFVERLQTALEGVGADKGSQLLFICRSGGRSLMAARAMAGAGFSRCANVTEGFEGPLDQRRRRGCVVGWKAIGLPWMQG